MDVLDRHYNRTGTRLTVSIAYEKVNDMLRISDNAMGMSFAELERGLRLAEPPSITTGRSQYGMGLKTAACWIGNKWTVRTKKLNEPMEYEVVIDVDAVAKGQIELPHSERKVNALDKSYTIIEIREHNKEFYGQTLGKIRNFLRSMYRHDLEKDVLRLEWQGESLEWEGFDSRLLVSKDGTRYKKPFNFKVDAQVVTGWVGILEKGSRANAGFSIIHRGRVVKGWPDSWRPSSIYGQYQGSNDLVNQRLVGEIHLDGFDVSHTKDDILWKGSQEEDVEDELAKACNDYRTEALRRRRGSDDQRGPSETETNAAIDELKQELMSPEMVDHVSIDIVPPKDVVDKTLEQIANDVASRLDPQFNGQIGDVRVKLYVVADMSPSDPYLIINAPKKEILVIVNQCHPHWTQLKGSEGVLNYLRHCVYDGIAEWQAGCKATRLDPNTIKMLKDALLRIPLELEQHEVVAN
jgi:hypothetical protein